jgi:D-alanine transaminase
MPEIAYVNGQFLPLDRAVIHVEDRGFQFADSVYEVIRTYGGRPFAMDEHLARLFRSLEAIELKPAFTADAMKAIVVEGIQRAGFAESVAYLQVTRGRASRHRGFPADTNPTVVLTVRELVGPATGAEEAGISVITLPDNRWGRCDIKSVALLPNVLAYAAARKAGAHDAIFVEADGSVTEATAGNVFIFTAGTLRTPPKGPKILPGVTREKILQAARESGIACREEAITKAELLDAEEIFISSTTNETLPVVSVDGKRIGSAKPGEVTKQVREAFLRAFVRKK